MNKYVKFLCVEDVYTDAELIRMELARAKMQFDFVVVDNKSSYIQALDQYEPDLILCDHTLPSFNSLEALTILRERERVVPFILITGSMTDEVALELVKNGADDYIMKDRLRRLPFSVMNALEKHEHEREKNKLLWKVLEYEDKTRKDLSNLTNKLTLATRAAKLTVWEYYLREDIMITDLALNDVLGCDVTQYTRTLERWVSLTHPDDAKILYTTLAECQKRCNDFDIQYRMILPNGSQVYVWVKGMVEADQDGKPFRVIGTTQNITEVKRRELKEKESEIRYKSVWENTSDAIILGSPDGQLLAANPAACAMLGRTEDELCSTGRAGILIEDENFLRKLNERTKSGITSGELTFRRGDGSTFVGDLKSSVFQDAAGRKRSITIVRDVTDRKKLEAQVLDERNRYTALFNHAPSAIGYMSGPEHVFEMANPLYVTLSGGRNIVGKTVKEAFPELGDHPIHEILNRVYTTGAAYRSHETRFPIQVDQTGEMTDIYLDFVYIPRRDEQGVVCGIFFFANDITEQVHLRNRIAESERNYKDLFEYSPLPKFILSQEDYSILEVNKLASTIYGYPAEEFASMNFRQLFSPEKVAESLDMFERAKGTQRNFSLVVEHVYNSGKKAVIELSVADFTLRGSPAFLVVANDITERTRLQNALTEMMVSAQKKITKAEIQGQEKEKQLIGRELHDNINQQLCTVQLLLNVARSAPDSYPEVLPKCESVVQSAIADIRTLCKSLVPPSIKDIGLRASLLELIEVYRNANAYTISESIDDKIDTLDEELQTSVYRILQELFTNITKYASPSLVSIEAFVDSARFTLRVKDDGKGFNTKEKRKGIGITNMKNRVELFGGKFKVKSAVGSGCMTEITVPLLWPDTPQSIHSKISILVAEDDALDQELMRSTISSVNATCEVTFVSNGKEAIDHLAALSDDQLPSLIVLDYNMPVLNGLETLKQLKKMPRLRHISKVVYSTSYHTRHEAECREADASAYIKKGATAKEMRKDITMMFKHIRLAKN